MSIIEHVERFLGPISQGWKDQDSDSRIQVVLFRNQPVVAVGTFVTIGLSHHVLSLSSDKKVRQELVLPTTVVCQFDSIVSCLLLLCDVILQSHRATLRGQVIHFPRDVSEAIGFNAVYCTLPTFTADEFSTFYGTEPPTVLVWTVPIFERESAYIHANGWSEFEKVLFDGDQTERESSLFSQRRAPVV